MKYQIGYLVVALILVLTLTFQPSTACAQGTAFTYNGQLTVSGNPANGSYDLAFSLFPAASGGIASTGPVTNLATPVSNGLFTVSLNFGAGVFTGSNYLLDISVSQAGSNTFTELSPRQPITPSPYAIYSANAGSATTAGIAGSANSVSAAGITGTLQSKQLPVGVVMNNQTGITLGGTFSGNGSGLMNLNASQLTSGTIALTELPGAVVTNNGTSLTLSGAFNGNGIGLTNLNAANLTGANALPVGVLPANVALLNANQTFTGVNIFNNQVGLGIAVPFRTFQVRPAANSVLGIYENTGLGGMTIESVNDANTANEPLEFRGSPNVFTTGNVVIGGTSSTEKLEVDGIDATVRIHNLNDAAGGFMGDTYGSLQFGMYNPSSSTQGVIPAGAKRSFFGFTQNGIVGSLTNNFFNTSFRNILDDGSGNMTIAGIIRGNGSGLTNLNVGQLSAAVLTNNANSVTLTGTFSGNGAGLTNLSASAITGGLTTNFAVLVPGGGTNILCFTNGILAAIQ